MSNYMGTYARPIKSGSIESARPYKENGDQKSGNFGLGFQYREDAEKFLEELRERVRKFGLELHPEKTRLIEFGRYAVTGRNSPPRSKPFFSD